jgi:hypothetical protein
MAFQPELGNFEFFYIQERKKKCQTLATPSKYWLTMLLTFTNFIRYKMIIGSGLPRVVKGRYSCDVIICQSEPWKPGEAWSTFIVRDIFNAFCC